jgi:hypothetical protein
LWEVKVTLQQQFKLPASETQSTKQGTMKKTSFRAGLPSLLTTLACVILALVNFRFMSSMVSEGEELEDDDRAHSRGR